VPTFCSSVRQRWPPSAPNVKRRLASVVATVLTTMATRFAGTASNHGRATRNSTTVSDVPAPPTSA
jgi:hypothetical protein